MPDVEGGILAARQERLKFLRLTKVSTRLDLREVFFRWAGKPGSTAGRDACRYAVQRNRAIVVGR